MTEVTSSKLAQINQLKQSIHNLKMMWPSGFKKIDDERERKRKWLETHLKEEEDRLEKTTNYRVHKK